jgi:small subunit ribosomal protein S19e
MNRYDVSQQALITALADELKAVETVKAPQWAPFVKTGVSRERPPTQENWWHVRSASMLRKVALLGPIGTQKLRRKYGGKQNRGYKPEVMKSGSGNITRKILQQLEAGKLVVQVDKDGHKGRIVTPAGQSIIDKAAKKAHGTQ